MKPLLALALLLPGRVPGQIVVEDSVEVVLEVDALGQAVGGDKDVTRVGGGELGDARLPLGRRQHSGDRRDLRGPGQCALKVGGEGLGRARGLSGGARLTMTAPVAPWWSA